MSFQIGCVLATNERSACFTLCFVLFVVKREVSCGHFVALLDITSSNAVFPGAHLKTENLRFTSQ